MRLIGALLATLILACLATAQSAHAQYWRDGYAAVVQPTYVRPGPPVWYGAYTRPFAWYPVGGVPSARPFYGAAYYTYATDLASYYAPYAYSPYATPYVYWGWPGYYGSRAFLPAWPSWNGWRVYGWGGCGCCC